MAEIGCRLLCTLSPLVGVNNCSFLNSVLSVPLVGVAILVFNLSSISSQFNCDYLENSLLLIIGKPRSLDPELSKH